ncbi:hypothetical protein ACN38_g2466 [Penicillium nordicum]|uniref:Uncharacterized protein n=1 Tax=Penicillium nordicum TaxID=229535 RepID=A0A0M8PFE2_9EURO|nr:hypothetical protein ACN38_g2466 [Penicillium nordicum]
MSCNTSFCFKFILFYTTYKKKKKKKKQYIVTAGLSRMPSGHKTIKIKYKCTISYFLAPFNGSFVLRRIINTSI